MLLINPTGAYAGFSFGSGSVEMNETKKNSPALKNKSNN